MASGSFSSEKKGYYSVVVDWSSKPNNASNTSDVTSHVYITYYSININGRSTCKSSIAGNSDTFSTGDIYHYPGGEYKRLIYTQTETVKHDSDGKKSINISASFPFNLNSNSVGWVGELSASKTVSLDNIPRASTISSFSFTNGYINQGIDIKIDSKNSSYYHDIRLYTPDSSGIGIELINSGTGRKSGGQYHINLSDSQINQFYSAIPSTTSAKFTVSIRTYSSATSSTTIGDWQSASAYASIPKNIGPSFSDTNGFVATINSGGLGGCFVQGKSTAKLTVNASPGYGSSIVSYTYSGPNISNNKTSTHITNVIQQSETLTYTVTVQDARGRTASKTVQIYVYPYGEPAISSAYVQRCLSDGVLYANGTYAKYSVQGTYSSINGNNTRTITVAYSSDDGATYSSATAIQAAANTSNSVSGVYGDGSFSVASMYKFKFTITDKYTSNSVIVDLGTAERPLNVAKYGNGVCIGGISSVVASDADGLFEVNWDTDINANQTITGDLTVGGSIITSDAYRIKYQTIPNGADLNDAIYKTPGFYRSTSSTNSITNKPSAMNNGAFELVVTGISDFSYCTQTVKDISSNTFYIRTQTSWGSSPSFPTWTEWSRILTSDIPANQYYPNYGINMNNSDLIGANSIYFADTCDSVDEGINFLRYDGGYDVLYAADGGIFLRKNQSATPIRVLTDDLMVIRRGTCTLNVSSATTVNFSSALPGIPTVMLTPLTNNSGVIAAKVRSVTASGFTAIIGGSGISDTQFAYLAIWTLQS